MRWKRERWRKAGINAKPYLQLYEFHQISINSTQSDHFSHARIKYVILLNILWDTAHNCASVFLTPVIVLYDMSHSWFFSNKAFVLFLPAGGAAGIVFTHGPIFGFFATHCTDQDEIWQRGTALPCQISPWSAQGCGFTAPKLKKMDFINIIAPKGRVPCTILTKFIGYMRILSLHNSAKFGCFSSINNKIINNLPQWGHFQPNFVVILLWFYVLVSWLSWCPLSHLWGYKAVAHDELLVWTKDSK